ncbi:hypothetical protein CWO91_25175 [Bradyrhizobium genosp. SA-3]|nr:hypothetical protein CWO91_25175 [Bradyrhizobium genosp. SA-3]
MNIAIRWLAGYGLHDQMPHHSRLTRIRQRWGEERFRRIFKRAVEACQGQDRYRRSGPHRCLADPRQCELGEARRLARGECAERGSGGDRDREKGRQSGKYKKACTTDPDATMAANARNRRLKRTYKQHATVDDKVRVILDVAVTTGQTNERRDDRAASGRSRRHDGNRY